MESLGFVLLMVPFLSGPSSPLPGLPGLIVQSWSLRESRFFTSRYSFQSVFSFPRRRFPLSPPTSQGGVRRSAEPFRSPIQTACSFLALFFTDGAFLDPCKVEAASDCFSLFRLLQGLLASSVMSDYLCNSWHRKTLTTGFRLGIMSLPDGHRLAFFLSARGSSPP